MKNELSQRIPFYLPFVLAFNEYLSWLFEKPGIIGGLVADLFNAMGIEAPAIFQNPFIAVCLFQVALVYSQAVKQQVQDIILARCPVLVELWVVYTAQGLSAFCLIILIQQGYSIIGFFMDNTPFTPNQVGFQFCCIILLSYVIGFVLLNLPKVKRILASTSAIEQLGETQCGLYHVPSGLAVLSFAFGSVREQLTQVFEAGLFYKSPSAISYILLLGSQFEKPYLHKASMGALCLMMTCEINVTSDPTSIDIHHVHQADLDTGKGVPEQVRDDLRDKVLTFVSTMPEYKNVQDRCKAFFKHTETDTSLYSFEAAMDWVFHCGLYFTEIDEALTRLQEILRETSAQEALNGGIFFFKARFQSATLTQNFENRKAEVMQKAQECFDRCLATHKEGAKIDTKRLEICVDLIDKLNGNISHQELKELLHSISPQFTTSVQTPNIPYKKDAIWSKH